MKPSTLWALCLIFLLPVTQTMKIGGVNVPSPEQYNFQYGEPYRLFNRNSQMRQTEIPEMPKVQDYLNRRPLPQFEQRPQPEVEAPLESPEPLEEVEETPDLEVNSEPDNTNSEEISKSDQTPRQESATHIKTSPIKEEPKHQRYEAFFAVYAIVLVAITVSVLTRVGVSFVCTKNDSNQTPAQVVVSKIASHRAEKQGVPISAVMNSFISHHVKAQEESLDDISEDKFTFLSS